MITNEKKKPYEKELKRLYENSKNFYKFMERLMEHLNENPHLCDTLRNNFLVPTRVFEDFEENVNCIKDLISNIKNFS